MNNNSQNIVNPWLSIIIPIYNAEKYLEDCFKSIIRQDFNNYEVLMIDDGSIDDSADICKRYEKEDSHFKYFYFENGGVYSARIHGLDIMRGSYFTFCDADDYYYNNHTFSTVFDFITYYKVDFIEFGFIKKYNHLYKKIRSSDKLLLINKEDFLMNEYPQLLCSKWTNSHIDNLAWNKVYSRNLKNNIVLKNKRLFWGDDQILNLQLLENCNSCLIIPDVLYCYRQGSGYTNKFSKNALVDLNIIKEWQIHFIDKYKYDNKDLIYSNLFGEISGWTFEYMKNALEELNEDEVINIIDSALKLPSFELAKNYYLTTNFENWDGVNLIRSSDINKYILVAKEITKKEKKLKYLKKLIKRIVLSI